MSGMDNVNAGITGTSALCSALAHYVLVQVFKLSGGDPSTCAHAPSGHGSLGLRSEHVNVVTFSLLSQR